MFDENGWVPELSLSLGALPGEAGFTGNHDAIERFKGWLADSLRPGLSVRISGSDPLWILLVEQAQPVDDDMSDPFEVTESERATDLLLRRAAAERKKASLKAIYEAEGWPWEEPAEITEHDDMAHWGNDPEPGERQIEAEREREHENMLRQHGML